MRPLSDIITRGISRSRQPDLTTPGSAAPAQGTTSATHLRAAHAAAATLEHRGGMGVRACGEVCRP